MKIPLLISLENPSIIINALQEAINKQPATLQDVERNQDLQNLVGQLALFTKEQSEGGVPTAPHMKVRDLSIFTAILDGAVIVNGKTNVTARVVGHNLHIDSHE